MPRDDVAPDGSPVELYLRLTPEPEAGLVGDALEPGASVLDLGCGTGRVGGVLVARGHRVTGVDQSDEMLRHAAGVGVEVVRGDIEDLDLGRRFDAVLVLSHLVSEADDVQRGRFWAAAARHVSATGVVIAQRSHPDWVRTAEPSISRRDGIEIELHDVDHVVAHGVDVLEAAVTYRIDGRSWQQRFRAVALDDDAFAADAAAHGLTFRRWLDDGDEIAVLSASGHDG